MELLIFILGNKSHTRICKHKSCPTCVVLQEHRHRLRYIPRGTDCWKSLWHKDTFVPLPQDKSQQLQQIKSDMHQLHFWRKSTLIHGGGSCLRKVFGHGACQCCQSFPFLGLIHHPVLLFNPSLPSPLPAPDIPDPANLPTTTGTTEKTLVFPPACLGLLLSHG